MSETKLELCMGCMRPAEAGTEVCPRCSFRAGTPNAAAYLPTGTVIGSRYIVGKMLRFNGESAEYIGYDRKNEQRVVVREYMPDTLCSRSKNGISMSVDRDFVATYKAFMSEFVELNKSLAKMRSLTHISTPVDMFGENNTGYVIFRYVDGLSIRQYFAGFSDKMSWNDTKEIFSPLFTTLSLVHNAGIIHRGIAPDNIVINENGEPVLIGFCIPDARTSGTRLSAELYPGYSAPEQYSTSSRQGPETDVYGLCAVLYRVLTGITPVPVAKRMGDDLLFPPHEIDETIPEHVSDVIMKGLDLSQDKRIKSVTELVTALFEEQAAPERHRSESRHISHETHHKGASEVYGESKKGSGKAFGIILVIAAIVIGVIIGVAMMALDDNSTGGLMGMQTTAPVTVAPETYTVTTVPAEETSVTTMPTLAVEETFAEEETSRSTVDDGTPIYVMNDLTGKTYDMVRNTPAVENLNIIPDYVYTDGVQKGLIFAQSIEKGTGYHKGDECIISISMGPSKVAVPDFTGLSRKDYFELLNENGIKYEEEYYQTNSILNGYVAYLSMEPGDIIDLENGEVLTVYIAYNSRPAETEAATTIVTIPPDETLPTEPLETEEPAPTEIFEEPEWDEITEEPEQTFEELFPEPAE
ncbi:MAG: PASTA domain-containing protein [Oscillospiraceae bacterium]|nr:PASTA domain-containing protein [Oscillospiraceae bacterium]